MLGKDARSRLAVGAAALVAAVGLATGTAHAGLQLPAPQPKADPFIDAKDVVTSKGQMTHIVFTYGNAGQRTLHNLTWGCWVVSGDSVRNISYTHYTYRSPLHPGQNANFEFWGYAKKPGKTRIQCSIAGIEEGTGKPRIALSRIATIRVNP
jgi:hypothetical protein